MTTSFTTLDELDALERLPDDELLSRLRAMVRQEYASTARLQIDRDTVQVVKGGDVNPTEASGIEFLRTQYELLQGRTMAERVVSGLRLGEIPEFIKSREFSLRGLLSSNRGAADAP